MTREEMFAKAKEERKKQDKINEDQKSSYSRDYEPLNYMGLIDNTYSLVRMIGDPLDVDFKSEFSPHSVYRSKVVGDGDKVCFLNLPNPYTSEGKEHTFWKIFHKVLKGKFVDDVKIYEHEHTHPTLFNRVFKNNIPKENHLRYKYESGFKATNHIVFQGIDRLDYDWHVKNKKLKVLSKKINVVGEKTYAEYGVPKKLYDAIWNSVVEHSGDWLNYDMALRRNVTQGNNKTKEYSYEAINADKEAFKLKDLESKVVRGPLTEEELSWEKVDIAKICQISSYTKILNKLGNFIRDFDSAFGTRYYDEVKAFSDAEKVQWEIEKAEKEKANPTPKTETKTETKIEEPKVEEKPVRQTRQTREVNQTTEFQLSSKYSTYLALEKLTDQEKSIIIGYENKEFKFDASDSDLVGCPECSNEQPVSIESYCIYCGMKF